MTDRELAERLREWASLGIEDDCLCDTAFKNRHQDDPECTVGAVLREAADRLDPPAEKETS